VDFLQPKSLAEALEVKAERPEALPIAGGTDVMVELNFDRGRPAAILDLTRAAELAVWDRDGGRYRVGAGVTYTRTIDELAAALPGLEHKLGGVHDRLGDWQAAATSRIAITRSTHKTRI